ncbi:hypothetical protein LOZ12_000335 [Ophidiomyces ophidiicola]|uniref:Uncharacterized protein n=1 Tax=Ophidiomyces ophidiicola TaxID=1387563 RepID=A0ACB8UUY7_9EURO|nr:hypothetical protein LOZ64_003010 [Ophidiomyces ophidiicola]KAI1967345.1 hypothetical protein LOZ59_000712 [Ophidiomyces ophidiicola]KAI2010716.1 hypothetical protein LOZ49_003346 [Ophidiomyces ophidiicola]KAI2012256.1 hypothetical protein LOZ50_000174 [Ophidiomyces ophidiicola]KAI2021452.1 hypothetical protein LOZ45_004723 [Ophidiomyces ophidiicola]
MQFSHALIALVAAGLANAQLPNVPSCSIQCFVSALGASGCSPITDFKCQCGKPELVGKIAPCVLSSCPAPSDQSAVSSAVSSVCSAAGVPIQVPAVPGGPGQSSAPGSSAPAPSAPGSSAPAPSAPGSSAPAPSVPGSSAPGVPTTAAPTTAHPTSGVPGVPSGTGSYTTTGRPTASTPAQFPGAGSNVRANVGGVAAVLLAVAAYL